MGDARGNNFGKFYSFQSKPVLLDLEFQVLLADSKGFGIKAGSLKGQGVKNVFMQSSATPATGNPFVNTTSAGYVLINLAYNYARAYCVDYRITSPVTGSALAINGSALTAGVPYQIVTVGSGTAGAVTIAPVADSAGSLASTWFRLYDAYGNTFIIWFSVSGVGTAPSGVSGTLVQQSIVTNDTAATIGGDLATTIAALPSGISGVFSFTTAGTTTVTVTSTTSTPVAGTPADGAIATGFTFATTKSTTNLKDWQKVGVPQGVTPAVGVSFVATATGYSTGGGSSGTVKAIGIGANTSFELIGDPNLSIGPIPMGGSPNTGSWFLGQFLAATSSSVTTLIPTAPSDNSIVKMTILLEQATRVGGNNE